MNQLRSISKSPQSSVVIGSEPVEITLPCPAKYLKDVRRVVQLPSPPLSSSPSPSSSDDEVQELFYIDLTPMTPLERMKGRVRRPCDIYNHILLGCEIYRDEQVDYQGLGTSGSNKRHHEEEDEQPVDSAAGKRHQTHHVASAPERPEVPSSSPIRLDLSLDSTPVDVIESKKEDVGYHEPVDVIEIDVIESEDEDVGHDETIHSHMMSCKEPGRHGLGCEYSGCEWANPEPEQQPRTSDVSGHQLYNAGSSPTVHEHTTSPEPTQAYNHSSEKSASNMTTYEDDKALDPGAAIHYFPGQPRHSSDYIAIQKIYEFGDKHSGNNTNHHTRQQGHSRVYARGTHDDPVDLEDSPPPRSGPLCFTPDFESSRVPGGHSSGLPRLPDYISLSENAKPVGGHRTPQSQLPERSEYTSN